jgi:SAM-dependent methyltransferase
MQSLTTCPICESSSIRTYVDAPNETLGPTSLGSSRVAVSHGTILRCQSCGFGFLASRLSEEELAQLYTQLDHQMYEAEAEGRARTAIQHFKIIHRHVSAGSLLDVGCASGGFLQICAQNGFQVTGVEPSTGLANKAREVLSGKGEVLCATLQQTSFRKASFDAVTLWDVLEHVSNPRDFLRLCRLVLKPEAYLFANVPDLDSFQARVLGRRWPLLLPEHFNYFTRKSLGLCAKNAGFELVRFGRRSAFFTVSYIFHRLAQHNIPGIAVGKRFLEAARLKHLIVPVLLGETYGVWRRRGRERVDDFEA